MGFLSGKVKIFRFFAFLCFRTRFRGKKGPKTRFWGLKWPRRRSRAFFCSFWKWPFGLCIGQGGPFSRFSGSQKVPYSALKVRFDVQIGFSGRFWPRWVKIRLLGPNQRQHEGSENRDFGPFWDFVNFRQKSENFRFFPFLCSRARFRVKKGPKTRFWGLNGLKTHLKHPFEDFPIFPYQKGLFKRQSENFHFKPFCL